MAQLPLVLAIPRFKENEERVDKLVNGTALETWSTSGGVTLPSFAKFLADKNTEINEEADGILAASQAAATAAGLSAAEAEADADEIRAITANIQAAVSKSDNEIWVTDPEFGGALLGSEGDWSPVIRAAIDKAVLLDRRVIKFPPRVYKLKTPMITTTSDGIFFFRGAGRNSRGTKIVVDFDGIGFQLQSTLPYVSGIAFHGDKTLYPNSRAIKSAKTVNTDDMDMFLELNSFENFPLAVEHVGRGLIARNNDFAMNNKDIDVSWVLSGVEATGQPLHDLPYGFRKWIIVANHSHSSGGFLTTSGADKDDFRGAVIANNLQDIGRQFLVGGIGNSVVSANVVENANSTPVYIDAGGHNMTIVGNHFGGMEGNDDVSIHRPGAAIWFDTSATIQGLTCTGNVLAYTDASALQFSNGYTESTIVGNTFRDYNKLANAADGAIRVVAGDVVRSTVAANSFDENPANQPVIRIAGSILGSYMLGNSWNNSQVLYSVGGTVDSGSMVERLIGEFVGRFAFVGDKDVMIKAKSLFNGTWVAEEAMGGFVVETADTTGGGAGIAAAIRAIAATTSGAGVNWRFSVSSSAARDIPILDINSVGLFPVDNGTKDLGSSTVKFRTGYFVSINLNGILLVTAAGSPEGVVTAPVGSWCTDTTNGVTYVKKTGTGNTGWKLITQAA